LQCVAVCCSVLQCVAVCCSVLQCVAACCRLLQCILDTSVTFLLCCFGIMNVFCNVLQHVAACCSMLHCVTLRWSYTLKLTDTIEKEKNCYENDLYFIHMYIYIHVQQFMLLGMSVLYA